MLRLLFCAAILIIISLTSAIYEKEWKSYKNRFNKRYARSTDCFRKDIFLETHKQILAHNRRNSSFKMGHNRFSDMTLEEAEMYMGLKGSSLRESSIDLSQMLRKSNSKEAETDLSSIEEAVKIPPTLDYRDDECLQPIKDQAKCGSCWAFSALTPIEFSHCKKTGHKVSLSEQHLIDCDYLNFGCNGGWYTRAWVYLFLTGGSVASSEYPYIGEEDLCFSNETQVVAQVGRIGRAGTNATSVQRTLFIRGPVAVAMAATKSFLQYEGGIYDDQESCANRTLNHAMVLVGYGSENETDYWIVRNSWGTKWGERGYARIKRGVNLCMTETYGFYAQATDEVDTRKEEEVSRTQLVNG